MSIYLFFESDAVSKSIDLFAYDGEFCKEAFEFV